MYGWSGTKPPTMNCALPVITSDIVAPVLLYGTMTTLIFAIATKSSVARWVMLPTPGVATARFPGFERASAMSSFVLLDGSDGCTESTSGLKPISAIGARLAIGSNTGLCIALSAVTLERRHRAVRRFPGLRGRVLDERPHLHVHVGMERQ